MCVQLQSPNVRQNTANGKLNYGLPHNLELDVDYPYLGVFRASGNPSSVGGGDADFGIKWESHKKSAGPRAPVMGASLYLGFQPVMRSSSLVRGDTITGSI
jgi:hypothetical protein